MAVAGVDGCPGGWVAALVDADGVAWRHLPDAAAVRAVAADVLAVDVPVGLPEAGHRRCDLEARRLLGARRSSVFLTPPRAVLRAGTYEEACAVSRRLSGHALSRQAYALRARILDVDDALADDPRVVEVHPELAFRLLAGRDLPSKHSAAGLAARAAALAGWRPDVLAVLERVPRPVRLDDALDALAAAWSAQRRQRGGALVLPDADDRDARGRPMRIVA